MSRQARRFLAIHHYAGASYPAALRRYGLMERETGELVGVLVVGAPTNAKVLTCAFPTLEPYRQSAEVSRLALIDDVLANGETWFLRESSGSCSRRASAAWSVSRTRCPYGRRHLHRPRHRTCTREGASTQWLPRPNRRSKCPANVRSAFIRRNNRA